MRDHDLAKVREWAQSKLDALEEPPWALNRCQQIIAQIDEILGSSPAPAVPRPRNVVPISSVRRRAANRYCRTSR